MIIDSELLSWKPELAKEFRRWEAQISSVATASPYSVHAREVLLAHFLIAAFFVEEGRGIGGVGPRSLNLFLSAVDRQSVGFGGTAKWTDLLHVAATLFFGLIKNHPFHDANKRTALLTLLFQLQCHNRVPDVPQKEFEHLAVKVAGGDLEMYPRFREMRGRSDAEIEFIAQFLRRNTRQIDKREVRLTFRQLGSILSRHGFEFGRNHDNRIEILKRVTRPSGFLRRTKRVDRVWIATIGFRNLGTEVSSKDIREVRRATGLTAERGFDTTALMAGVNPMETLIAEYSEPLRRLARK